MNKFRIFQMVSQQTRLYQGVAFLRVAIGLYFFYAGYQKYHNPQFAIQLPSMLQTWAHTTPLFWYEDFLKLVVIPQAGFFAAFVTYAEMLIGASFILGALVPYTSLLALFLNINYLLALLGDGTSSLGVNVAFILISMVLFWTDAGQYYGLDQYLFRDDDTLGLIKKLSKKVGPPKPPKPSKKPFVKQPLPKGDKASKVIDLPKKKR